jgi:hypothetical protein
LDKQGGTQSTIILLSVILEVEEEIDQVGFTSTGDISDVFDNFSAVKNMSSGTQEIRAESVLENTFTGPRYQDGREESARSKA